MVRVDSPRTGIQYANDAIVEQNGNGLAAQAFLHGSMGLTVTFEP